MRANARDARCASKIDKPAARARGQAAHDLARAIAVQLGAEMLQEPQEVVPELVTQQLVHLVQNDGGRLVRAQHAGAAELCEAAGRADDDEGSVLLDRVDLAPHVGAADGLLHQRPRVLGQQALRHAERLHGELARGRDQDRLGAKVVTLGLGIHAALEAPHCQREHGQQEGERLHGV